jgi:hypothetical protein
VQPPADIAAKGAGIVDYQATSSPGYVRPHGNWYNDSIATAPKANCGIRLFEEPIVHSWRRDKDLPGTF